MSLTIRTVAYKGWKNCCRIANGTVELIVTTDVGPRIIRYGFVGGQNLLKEDPAQVGKSGGKAWRLYGGHRLWHSPEDATRTYFPDNFPVTVERHGNRTRFIAPVETTCGIQKELEIKLGARVEIVHRLRNTGLWPIELAPWALSVMAPGGTCIVPQPKRGTHPKDLLPQNVLVPWIYTDMSDPRWTWGRRYILLRQAANSTPQKLGALVPDGWAAYALNGQLFVKRFPCLAGARYPDNGCNFETFTNSNMLEVETLGPLTTLAPGQTIAHNETWQLFNNVPAPKNDRDVDRHILPQLNR
ncbi:MAG: hypothetical protein PCFJNLEI_03083 [Verrucomicrobiae bacterium]|nr:hypothetical protein [Verrucomicrobiae bacterium]